MNPLLIGQAPGPNTNPDLPLFPLPRTSTGGRLAAFMGLSRTQYLRSFDRVNLLQFFPGKCKRDDKFPLKDAKIAAAAMKPLIRGRQVILVGRNVSQAFLWGELPFHTWITLMDGTDLSVIPHPSGRNHWYNSEGNREEARTFWAEYLAKMGLPAPLDAGKLLLQA